MVCQIGVFHTLTVIIISCFLLCLELYHVINRCHLQYTLVILFFSVWSFLSHFRRFLDCLKVHKSTNSEDRFFSSIFFLCAVEVLTYTDLCSHVSAEGCSAKKVPHVYEHLIKVHYWKWQVSFCSYATLFPSFTNQMVHLFGTFNLGNICIDRNIHTCTLTYTFIHIQTRFDKSKITIMYNIFI